MKSTARNVPVPGGLPHWFQGGVYLIIFGVLSLWLLSALNQLKDAAARQAVELTIRNIEVGIRVAALEKLSAERGVDVQSWAGANPLTWLGTSPSGYQGECSTQESESLRGGEWCFEQERRELIYRPFDTRQLRHEGTAETTCEDLRWRVSLVENGQIGSYLGVHLVAANNCRWVLE